MSRSPYVDARDLTWRDRHGLRLFVDDTPEGATRPTWVIEPRAGQSFDEWRFSRPVWELEVAQHETFLILVAAGFVIATATFWLALWWLGQFAAGRFG